MSLPDENQAAETPIDIAAEPRGTSERKRESNRANALKSTGPRTKQGKRRVTWNLPGASTRLLGLADARTLDQEPGAAEKLYRELIAPYQPAPPLLALHFQDLARLQLELQAWERIRDAQLDHRAQQTSIEVRRKYRDMDRELGSPEKVHESGLQGLDDAPAKFKAQIECLSLLKDQLWRRAFDRLATPLQRLYGQKLNPDSERARLICYDCERLMEPEGREPVSDAEFEELLRLVDREEQDALEGYELQLDERTVTGSASLVRLAPSRDDYWMNQQGDRLRQAIDRNKKLIPALLETMGLAESCRPTKGRLASKSVKKTTPAKVNKSRRINKTARKRG